MAVVRGSPILGRRVHRGVHERVAAVRSSETGPGLKVPTMLIVGSADPYYAHMAWLAANIGNATLCVLDGVGHFPFVERRSNSRSGLRIHQ